MVLNDFRYTRITRAAVSLGTLRVLSSTVSRLNQRQLFALVASATLIGIGARLLLAVAYPEFSDLHLFHATADLLDRGGNVYAESRWYNYAPPWMYILVGLEHVSAKTELPFAVLVRGLLIAVDLIDALVIGAIAARWHGKAWQIGYSAFLVCPVSIILTGTHGQFENVAALPLLIATWQSGRIRARTNWLLGSAAMLLKQVIAFQVWMLFGAGRSWKKATMMTAAAVAVWAASFLPFLPEGADGIMQHVLGYQSVPGLYGLGLLPRWIAAPLFFAAMVLLPLAAERLRLSPSDAMRLSAVAFVTLTYGIGEQYWLLPVLLGAAAGGRMFWLYAGTVTVFLAGSRDSLWIEGIPTIWNSVWCVAFAWLITLMWPLLRARAEERSGSRTYTALAHSSASSSPS